MSPPERLKFNNELQSKNKVRQVMRWRSGQMKWGWKPVLGWKNPFAKNLDG